VRTTTELRDEILNAARAEFAQYGLAGARIDRIAKAANASKERLYAHFGDKDALFRQVVTADGTALFRAVEFQLEDPAEFAGEIFDVARRRPEHLRMVTWARLEGLALDRPETDGEPLHEQAIAAIETAQSRGLIDLCWDPTELLVILFGLGLAWAHWPDPSAANAQSATVARRRAAAVEAARRVIAPEANSR
jgi:AcrR family transcriptional regulator